MSSASFNITVLSMTRSSNEADVSHGRNNFHDWFLLSSGPTHGIKDPDSKASSHVDSNFVVPLCKVAVFLASVFQGLAKCFAVNDVFVVGSCCELCCNSCHVFTFLFSCQLGQHVLVWLHRGSYVLNFLSHLPLLAPFLLILENIVMD